MIELHNGFKGLSREAQHAVVVIGNFDGVHLGHQTLLRNAKGIAEEKGRKLVVMTFNPHPRQFFQKEMEPFCLTSSSQKLRLFEKAGVDIAYNIPFDTALSQLTAGEFISKVLVDGIQADHVVVGHDFAFGKGRSGNVETLRQEKKFQVTVIDPVKNGQGDIYSSSRIRELLRQGNLKAAETLLGRPWEMEALVIHGDKRGREMGYPTANQDVSAYVRLPFGVYAVRVQVEGEDVWRDGVANFGIRPMFQVKQPLFETFIFEFNKEIYEKLMCVQPIKYLRPEMALKDMAALTIQIERDCNKAKAVLKSGIIRK